MAEGAGESLLDVKLESNMYDESGNKKPIDIGLYLKDEIIKYMKDRGLKSTLKYIDPTYMIRSTSSNPYDT